MKPVVCAAVKHLLQLRAAVISVACTALETMLVSLVHADPGDHVGVHDPCCC